MFSYVFNISTCFTCFIHVRQSLLSVWVCVGVCVCACMRACMRACVRACERNETVGVCSYVSQEYPQKIL